MYISPIGYRFSAMNSNINRMNRVPNITEANKTDKVAFTGDKKEGATPQDLLLSEVYKEYSPEKIIAWANQFGYTTVVNGGEILVNNAKGEHVRIVHEDWNNPGKVFEDTVAVLDESGDCQVMYRRFSSGTAELDYGGFNGSAWNNYAFRDVDGNWTGVGPDEWKPVPIANPIDEILKQSQK